jgi:aarF domain-containing kinase
MWTGAKVVVDFRRNLKRVERDSPEYKDALRAFNLRTATHLLDLCFQNGGIYTKFGQQLATFNHALPREFTDTLATLQDQAKAVPFAEAMKTVEQELQKPWQQVFSHIDETPVASASLAQVHDAVDQKGRRVAVKIQYPHLVQQTAADVAVIRWAFRLTEYFFPNIQVSWIFPEFEKAMAAEVRNIRHTHTRIATGADV